MNKDSNYFELFEKIFKNNVLYSTNKCVLIHALADIGLYGNNDMIGKQWITLDNHIVKLDLNFIAIRFIKSYWEISELDIKHVMNDSKNKFSDIEINVFTIINQEKSINKQIPDLDKLSTEGMNDFRHQIINDSIKPELLVSVQKDFKNMFEITPNKDSIVFDIKLLKHIQENIGNIKENIETKLIEYLEKINPNIELNAPYISKSNPFFRYISKYPMPQLFLISVDNYTSSNNFEKMIQKKIMLDDKIPEIKKQISIWGLKSTIDNKKNWEKIKKNDKILFRQDNRCFAQSNVLAILQDEEVSIRLWGKEDNQKPLRNLLIILDNITSVDINLVNYRVPLINPTIPDAYNFPITQVNKDVVSTLSVAYGGIDIALNDLSTFFPVQYTHEITVTLKQKQTTVRQGQAAFRHMVLENYHNRCAVCDISEKDLLEASHILPVGHLKSAGEKNNGICLCVLHHKMFDRGYIHFDLNYNLIQSDRIPNYLKKSFTKNKITSLDCGEVPSKAYLQKSSILFKYYNNV